MTTSKTRRPVDDYFSTSVGRQFFDEMSTSEFLRQSDVEKWSEIYFVKYLHGSDVAWTSIPNVNSTSEFYVRPTSENGQIVTGLSSFSMYAGL